MANNKSGLLTYGPKPLTIEEWLVAWMGHPLKGLLFSQIPFNYFLPSAGRPRDA